MVCGDVGLSWHPDERLSIVLVRSANMYQGTSFNARCVDIFLNVDCSQSKRSRKRENKDLAQPSSALFRLATMMSLR